MQPDQGKVRCDCLQVKVAYLCQFVVFWLQVAQGVLITVLCVLITHTVSMTTDRLAVKIYGSACVNQALQGMVLVVQVSENQALLDLLNF